MSWSTHVHAFTDDALADHDAVTIAALIRSGELGTREVEAAAMARIEQVEPALNALACPAYDHPRRSRTPEAPLYGVPTLVKDNTDIAGMPTNHGTDASGQGPRTGTAATPSSSSAPG